MECARRGLSNADLRASNQLGPVAEQMANGTVRDLGIFSTVRMWVKNGPGLPTRGTQPAQGPTKKRPDLGTQGTVRGEETCVGTRAALAQAIPGRRQKPSRSRHPRRRSRRGKMRWKARLGAPARSWDVPRTLLGRSWGPPGALPAAFWVPLEGQEALLDAKTRRSTEHRKTHGFTWFLNCFAARTSPGVPKRLWNGPCWVHKARVRVHKDHVGVHKAQVGYTRPFWKATCAIYAVFATA